MSSLPYYTTDTLIESIKRRAAIPTSQSTFKNEDFIAFLNEEMSLGLVPSVLRMKEDYLLVTLDIPLEQNKTQYTIPVRAIGNKVREISFKDTNDNVLEMTRIQIGDLPYYSSNNNSLYAYYIANNVINLMSATPTVSGFLSISYYIRPNQLVMLANVGVIQSINRTTGEIFLDKIPSGFSVTADFDLVQHTSPHKCLSIDLSVTSVNALTKSVVVDIANIPEQLSAGDHFCLAQQSAIPQIPSDLHVILAHRAAARCLEAQGDLEGLQAANAKLAEFEKNTENLIDDRVEDSPKKLVSRHSHIRSGLTNRRNRFRG